MYKFSYAPKFYLENHLFFEEKDKDKSVKKEKVYFFNKNNFFFKKVKKNKKNIFIQEIW